MPRFAEILAYVSARRDIPVAVLKSPMRTRQVTHARQEVAYLAREMTKHSLPEIGRRIGRDHTTVLHSLRSVEKRMCDNSYRCEITNMQMGILAFTENKFIRHGKPLFISRRSAQ